MHCLTEITQMSKQEQRNNRTHCTEQRVGIPSQLGGKGRPILGRDRVQTTRPHIILARSGQRIRVSVGAPGAGQFREPADPAMAISPTMDSTAWISLVHKTTRRTTCQAPVGPVRQQPYHTAVRRPDDGNASCSASCCVLWEAHNETNRRGDLFGLNRN